ncbi:phosphatidylglycerophosphate synthase 1 [Planoprotostelium fungivorum]|uniref:CDP-diacylglycerol--glycerol-3-phosphate 3-phosphatidyltransferase n=1 Tax=Planoprotostelium fungivorum TaxID=1890364 RepID=A0A2P6NK00_9EUKA|nr:phosphatidylglycerophosphate synthase 1 [Planoprotostelium fungivorum]
MDIKSFEGTTSSCSSAPAFRCQQDQVHFLKDPSQFYDHLMERIGQADRRITITSLYLGTGEREKQMVEHLKESITRRPDMQINILLDALRGTRSNRDGDSSQSLLYRELSSKFPKNVRCHFFHTPKLHGIMKKLIPPRINEIYGVQHMKIYLFDDNVMTGGANLGDSYFVGRQDRYLEIRNHGDLSDYYQELVEDVSSFSYRLGQEGSLVSSTLGVDAVTDNSRYKETVNKTLTKFNEKWMKKTDGQNYQADSTYLFPTIQMGSVGYLQDERVVTHLLEKSTSEGHKCLGCSPYMNLTRKYSDILLGAKGEVELITASPEANAFFGEKDISGYIPAAYAEVERRFWDRIRSKNQSERVQLREYVKEGWTFHGKGIWSLPPNEDLPNYTVIGSANLGQRSSDRDLESQLVVLSDERVEYQHLRNTTVTVDEELLNRQGRKSTPLVRWGTRILSSFM